MTQDILIITATLGLRDSLRKTVSSIREIGRARVKHILVAPSQYCEKLKQQYPNLEIMPEPAGCTGIYPALNAGFNAYAKNFSYIGFLNDDDYWLPDFRKLIEILDKKNNVDVVYGRTQYIDERGNYITEQTSSARYKSFKALLTQDIVLFTQQATLMRSEVFFKVDGFDESYKLVADTKFWIQAIDFGFKFYYKNVVGAVYTIQNGQLSSDKHTQHFEHERLFSESFFNTIKQVASVEKFLFRFANISIYLKRALKFKKMVRMGNFFQKVCGAMLFLPWKIRRFLLIKIYKYEIHPTAHIGLAWVYPQHLIMKENSKIGHFTVAIHLDSIEIGENSSIGRSNWITGFPTGTSSKHFSHQADRKSELLIGKHSAITKKHHLDCTNRIKIGNYVTVAGYDSQFLTHSINVHKNRQDSAPILISDWCFVSTRVVVLGGSTLPANSVLAAGAVLNKAYSDEWNLYGGVPAKPIKNIPQESKYFHREKGFVI
jgi:acetyltransferase-like isoleucine patch superfamily enzyme/GT2 family glycosyltransferase